MAEATRLGMEVRAPRFEFRKAVDALTNARVQIHSFKVPPVKKLLEDDLAVTAEVQEEAQAALEEHTARRVRLAASLAPILVVIGLLLLYNRTLPPARE